MGPYRVFPGRLSVSRTFGDIEAKYKAFGGLPNVVIAEPEVNSMRFRNNMDFIVLGSDGIFDQMSNEDVSKCAWVMINKNKNEKNLHSICGTAVDMILKTSLVQKSLDNVTCLLIALPTLERMISKGNVDTNQIREREELDKKLNLQRMKIEYSTEFENKNNFDLPLRNHSTNEVKRVMNNNISVENNSSHPSKTTSTKIYYPKENKTNYKDFASFNRKKIFN